MENRQRIGASPHDQAVQPDSARNLRRCGQTIASVIDVNAVTVREILQAIRALPRPLRLRLAEQLIGELGDVRANETEQFGPHMEPRGRWLVYNGPLSDAALDHRADREERLAERR